MNRAARYRLLLVGGAVLVLEILCRIGVIDHLTMQPPSEMVRDLVVLLASGAMNGAMLKTFVNVAIAAALAVAAGIAFGVAIHGYRAVRQGLEPLFATYYAIPVYAFYPMFIILFGLGDTPQVLIGFMLAVVAVIVNTLNGLDRVSRVLMKTARIYRLGPLATARKITLPSAAPYLLTGVKLAVAYAFIGVIGAEFIMSRTGIGYEISFAYNNFDNKTMYPLILLILVVSILINATLSRWERLLMQRRSRS
ncbi:MAG TPA: ABC transporter permease subunit [Xanthobacteraceae bacterium]|nr:ABC transporter permease subunit [Xanthobacteraceae bacterium]